MKRILKISQLLLLSLMVILFVSSCKSKKKSARKIDPGFSSYIKAFPAGVIGNQSNIVIELFEEIANITPEQEADKSLLSFSPKIKGQIYWKNNHVLVFVPEEPMPSNQLYVAKLQLHKLIQVPDKLKTFEFQFRIRKMNLNVQTNGLQTYKTEDLTRQKLSGTITTNDFASPEKVEKVFAATQAGKELTISWEHLNIGTIHNFTVEEIIRGKDKSEVILQWDGSDINSTDKGDQIIEIPSLDDFTVFDIKLAQQPEQCITIYFSDPLDAKQELQGLIRLKNGTSVKLVMRENSILVYPASRLSLPTDLIVEQGIINIMGYQLKERFSEKIEFTNLKPAVQFIGNGVILPNSSGLHFPFKAVNLSAVNVKIIKIFEDNIAQFLQTNQFDGNNEMRRVGRIVYKKAVPLIAEKSIDFGIWNTFSLDLSKLIEPEPGAIYRVNISFEKSQSLYPCSEEPKESKFAMVPNFEEDKEIAQYDEPGGYYYYDDYEGEDYDYNYSDRDNPCKDSYYIRNRQSIARNILASDLGILVKGNPDNELIAAVTNLITTEPMQGVRVEIYNYQNQLMEQGTTDSDGKCTFKLNSKPFLLVAKLDKQRGYLRLDDGSALSLSMFDIGGQQNKKGVKGFIYGERGVWRPGDSIYLTFILEDKNHSLPESHPVVMELYTPENQLYERKIKTSNLNGFYDFRTATKTSDQTGNWLAKIKVGGSIFTQYLKVETVKPNRLKINIDFGTEILKKGSPVNGTLKVTWLHGAVGKNLKADINVRLSKSTTAFKGFDGYAFDDPSKNFESEEKLLFSGNVNENGEAALTPKFEVGTNAPGVLKATFKTRAFEEGGDFSSDLLPLKYSPYTSYVGVKIPEGKGWNGSLYSNESNLIPIVTVDENGKPVDRTKVKIEIYDIYWRWWWEYSDNDDLGSYIANQSQNLLSTTYVDTKNGKVLYDMNLKQESWGRKLIRITDPISGHSCGQLFYTSYKGWWNRNDSNNPGGAEMLTFSTDKKIYKVGDEVSVELPASKQGRAFVSIESGSKVVDNFWVKVDQDNGKFSFKTTAEMAPNVFIHVTYIQPHNQTTNDLPIRLYGVQPIGVENPETHLEPVLTMPDVLEPEQNVTLQIKEKQGRPMTYTIAVVDEGLLDLTRFKTPEAWEHFYAREALGVKTWDLYKYVMGAFSGEMAGLLAIGGDEDMIKKEGQKANRFKPVVTFMGPFELRSGTQSHTFKMPNYVGSVKTMVIAGYDGAYGKAEKATPVKKPLMVVATLPRVVGPGEKVQLPVTLFVMDKSVKNVSLKIETNEFFSITEEAKKSVTFEKEGDETVYFNLNVSEKIGIGKVKVIAQSGKEKAIAEIEIDVRLPNPRVTQIIDAIIEPGKEWISDYKAVGIEGTNKGVIEVSTMLPINLGNRLAYLLQYPHGCIEQTTSAVFPQLHLASILDLTKEQKQQAETNIKAGIDKLKSFQLGNGGMSYWPGESGQASDWGTNYAGHFMIEAQKAGYSLPPDFMRNWIKFQTEQANDWSINMSNRNYHYNSDQLIQSYRLYTLALAGKPALGAMNRLREMKDLSITSKWSLAAAYYLAGRENVAQELIVNLSTTVKSYKELSYSYGSDMRDQAMILETLVLMKQTGQAKKVAEELAEKLSSGKWYSTQTTAYSLLAMAKFAGITGADTEINYEFSINGSKMEKISTKSVVSQQELRVDEALNGNVKIKNNSQKMVFVKIQLSGIPLTGDASNASNDLYVKVRYLDLKFNPIDPVLLTQGYDFIAEVRIEHPGIRGDYKEMALTQIFPSGWEIRNLRMEESSSNFIKDIPRYMDIRDDRIYSYFDIDASGSRTFRVLLNATYVGKFYLPTLYCEAMYDNEINGKVGGKWVEVVK
jgi:uncharacterized protein YfaS (alpha-2-macroglobulin family)